MSPHIQEVRLDCLEDQLPPTPPQPPSATVALMLAYRSHVRDLHLLLFSFKESGLSLNPDCERFLSPFAFVPVLRQV